MKGIELRNFLYMNRISQDEVAKYLGVKRQTINNWCNKDVLTGKILTKAKQVIEHFSAIKPDKIATFNDSGLVINGDSNDVDIQNDHRQYYSDSPDVLRAQIDLLNEWIKEKDEQIKEKDAQIKEKDAQIAKLLDILKKE